MLDLQALPACGAGFIEPMERWAVAQLPEESEWVYEILCGQPHKIFSGDVRYVALTLIREPATYNFAESTT